MIENLHIQDWSNDYIKELINDIYKLFESQNIPKTKIRKIYAVGSRVFKEYQGFKRDSDLDVLVYIDSNYVKKLRKLYNIMFNTIPVHVLVLDYKDLSKTLGNYDGLSLPYYDIISRKYYKGNDLDILEHLRNRKGRLNIERPCFICKEKSKAMLQLKYINFHNVTFEKKLEICDNCFQKYFGNNFSRLVNSLKGE